MEILSQDEIDQLLNAITGSEDEVIQSGNRSQKKIVTWDPHLPLIPGQAFRKLAVIHEFFARNLSNDSSSGSGPVADFHISSVDRQEYGFLDKTLPEEGFFQPFLFPGTGTRGLFVLDTVFCQSFISRALGNKGDLSADRAPTAMESSVVAGWSIPASVHLGEAWAETADVVVETGASADSLDKLALPAHTSRAFLVEIEARFKSSSGRLFIVYFDPPQALYDRSPVLPGEGDVSPELLDSLPVSLRLTTEAGSVSGSDLADLLPGQTIPLTRLSESGKLELSNHGSQWDSFSFSETDSRLCLHTPPESSKFTLPEKNPDQDTEDKSVKGFSPPAKTGAKSTPEDMVWSRFNTEELMDMLEGQHPQITALALCCLDPEVAADILTRRNEDEVDDIMRRVLFMAPPHNGALLSLNSYLKSLSGAGNE